MAICRDTLTTPLTETDPIGRALVKCYKHLIELANRADGLAPDGRIDQACQLADLPAARSQTEERGG